MSKSTHFILEFSRTDKAIKHKTYIMDSTTITLFSNRLKGAGHNPKLGKKKGGIKAHTVISSDENTPQLVRFTSPATHDHVLLKYLNLPKGSIVTFDKEYVNYSQYERFSDNQITHM